MLMLGRFRRNLAPRSLPQRPHNAGDTDRGSAPWILRQHTWAVMMNNVVVVEIKSGLGWIPCELMQVEIHNIRV